MSRSELVAALEDCLARLDSGASPEDCLRRYAHLRADLEPLLSTAALLRQRREAARQQAGSVESAAALARVRARFLAEAHRRAAPRAASRQLRAPRPQWMGGRALARALVSLASILVVLVGLFGGGRIASANSIPGDPLYGIKRLSEKVQLAFTLSQAQRAQLEERLEAVRLSEVHRVTEQRREVQVDFSGPVESVEGDTLVVQGIAVRLAPQAQVSTLPAVGTRVSVLANTQPDGSVEASVVALAPTRNVVSATGTPTPRAPVESPTREQQSAASPTPVAQATSVHETATLQPVPRDTVAPRQSPTPTQAPATRTPSPEPTETEEDLPTATATSRPSATPTQTLTPTQTRTPAPPREIKVRLEGTISELAADYWVVDGRRVEIRADTRIDQTAAQAEVGGWAIVQAIAEPNGLTVAQEITVLRGAKPTPVEQEFSGVIEALAQGQWTVAGRAVLITAETKIEGTPAVGALAQVLAASYSDGRLVALRIHVEALEVVQFTGIIEEIQADRWVVSGQVVLITAETQVEGTPAVGALADVEAVASADGVLTARRVRVDASGLQSDGE